MTPLLRARGVGRIFGAVVALDDLNLDVDEGSIVGLIGPSGSGKSTAVRLLCGIDRPSTGSIEVFGVAMERLPRRERYRIGLLAQDPALVEEFTIGEQVRFAARLRNTRTDDIGYVLERLGLAHQTATVISNASGGMRRRTGLAATLISDPDLAFLDEPTAGLDPMLREEIWAYLRRRRRHGRTMVITTQHIDEAGRCDRVMVLRDGRVIADDRPSELAAASGLSERVIVGVSRDDADEALALLRPMFVHVSVGPISTTSPARTVRVEAADGADAAARCAGALLSAGIDVESIDTEAPGLADVFRSIVESA